MGLREAPRSPSDQSSSASDLGVAGARGSGRTTLHNVQGLRGIAALIVVMAHVSGAGGFEARVFGNSWTSASNLPANTGVDLFFVISGLIMVVTTWRTFDDPGSSRRFLLRRIARIYPLYWVINSAILALYLLSPASVRFDKGQRPDILGSFLLLPHEGRLPVLVAWSLVFEMYFYLVFAVALVLGRSRLPWVLGGWVAVTAALVAIAPDPTNPYLAVVANPLSLEFVLGAGIGLAVVHGWLARPRAVLTIGLVSFAACLVLLAASGWEVFPSPAVRVAVVALPAGLVVYGAVGVEVRLGRVVAPFVQRLGDASYSLYLTHVPALTVLALLLAGRSPTAPWAHAVVLAAALGIVVCGALTCHVFLERPLQRGARRLLTSSRDERRAAAAVSSS